MEVVTTTGEAKVMLKQEMYSLLVQVMWTLKQRACENMLVWWIRKNTSQLHDFDWEVSLIVPTPGQGFSPHLVFGNAQYPAPF